MRKPLALRCLPILSACLLLCLPGCTRHSSSSDGKTVNLAIWSNYLSPETLAEFERRTGVKVRVSNYSSNEELLAKLQAGASGYDVIVPSDYMVFAMGKLGLLRELDPAKVPNRSRLDARCLKKQFDPSNRYSLPLDWGSTGIAVNRSLYSGKMKGWRDLFGNQDLAGKLTLLDDVRETLGAALKAQGFSLNSRNSEELKKARDLLIQVRPRVKAFTSEPLMPLVNGETAVAHAYMSDALQASRQTGGKIEYVIPEEGATLWIDNLAIPASAGNAAGAYALIDFLLDPEIARETTLAVRVAPCNREVEPLLPPELRGDPALFPRPAVLGKLEMLQDLGEALSQWDRVWTEVKARSD